MPKTSSETTSARIALARRNEELVLAEASLDGIRIVALVRIGVLVLRGFAMGAAWQAEHLPKVPAVGRVGFAYLALSIFWALGVWRARPNIRKARLMPYIPIVTDHLAIFAMAYLTARPDGRNVGEMVSIGFAVVISFALGSFDDFQSLVSTLLGIAGYLGIVFHHHRADLVAMTFVICGYSAIGFLIIVINRHVGRMFVELRKRDNLTRFLPHSVVEKLMSSGLDALAPVQREVTVLFTDIRDFTTFSEKLPPRAVLEFLDDYFGHMSQIVKAHDGTVNKFLGDGMLAFWGVPNPDEQHAEKALKAALDIRKKLAEINAQRAHLGQPPIRIGMGIHSGTVAAGMLGGAEQHEYTVIGDAVNVASRVEGLTKTLGVDVLVSESTWMQVADRFSGTRLAEEKVKGRDEHVVVYALDARTEHPHRLATAS